MNKEPQSTSFEIKLPSSTNSVTKNSIWSTIRAISKTGDIFTKEQLIKTGGATTNKDALKRIISYLKYLNLLTETRENSATSKGDSSQRFQINKTETVKDLMYELKAGRDATAKNHWKNLLSKHQLFTILKTEFFKNDSVKTYVDLEHFLRGHVENNTPQYIQNGGKFIVSLLSDVGLLVEKGNDITLMDLTSKTEPSQPDQIKQDNFSMESSPNDTYVEDDCYFFTIKGPEGMNYSKVIKDEYDIQMIKILLNKVMRDSNIAGKVE